MNFMPLPIHHAPAQRAVGRLALAFRWDPQAQTTRLATLYQQGCLKARLPRPLDADMPEAVTMNISGGIAGGDGLESTVDLGPGARASLASQAAERIYGALDQTPARIATRLTLGENARLDYLPQETILFDRFALRRSLDIDLATNASFLGLESLVFGRQAMGETIRYGRLDDRIAIRQNGRLVFQDITRLHGDIARTLARKAVANGAIAMACLIHAGPGAANRIAALRQALDGAQAGVSIVEDIVIARILAPSAILLRKTVIAALKICRDGRALPRVWQS